jgi:hypothetical protein
MEVQESCQYKNRGNHETHETHEKETLFVCFVYFVVKKISQRGFETAHFTLTQTRRGLFSAYEKNFALDFIGAVERPACAGAGVSHTAAN